MATRLPKRLGYLRSVIEQLAIVDPDELDECNGLAFSPVNEALRQRVAGLSPTRAEQTLQQDAAALNAWLAQPGKEQSPAHYISGVLLGISQFGGTDELLGTEPKHQLPPPKSRAVMEPPEGFDMIESEGSLLLIKTKLEVVIAPYVDPPWWLFEKPYEFLALDGFVDTKVNYGELVQGKKRELLYRHKDLQILCYFLEVPGGWVDVNGRSVQEFDESILESKFHTLRVESTEASLTNGLI